MVQLLPFMAVILQKCYLCLGCKDVHFIEEIFNAGCGRTYKGVRVYLNGVSDVISVQSTFGELHPRPA